MAPEPGVGKHRYVFLLFKQANGAFRQAHGAHAHARVHLVAAWHAFTRSIA